MKLIEVEEVGMDPRRWPEHQIRAAIRGTGEVQGISGISDSNFDLEYALLNVQVE